MKTVDVQNIEDALDDSSWLVGRDLRAQVDEDLNIMTYRELQNQLFALTQAQLDEEVVVLDPSASYIINGKYEDTMTLLSVEVTAHGVPVLMTNN